jgi:DNA-binding MarR family transcriptional regulator
MPSSGTFAAVPGLADHQLGHEARAQADDHMDLKIWLRMLACSAQIEREIRHRLRVRFGTTLPRFDYLAQLERHPKGLRMNQLSSYLMVTGGNVTGLTDQLAKEGLVKRIDDPDDRRSYLVALTAKGRKQFAQMAAAHERWLNELFDGIDARDKRALYDQLARLRVSLARQRGGASDGAAAATPTDKTRP